MAFHALRALLLVAGIAVVKPADATEQTLRDGGQPSYQLAIPDGWDVVPNQAPNGIKGVTMKRGEASAALWIKSGMTQASEVLTQVKPQLQRQWKNFTEVDSGSAIFSGRSASFVVYSGIPSSGTQATVRIVTMTDTQYTYLLFLEAPVNEVALRADLDRIQSSFALLKRAE